MTPRNELFMAVQIVIGPVHKLLDSLMVLEKELLTNPKGHATLRNVAAEIEARSAPEAQQSFDFSPVDSYREAL